MYVFGIDIGGTNTKIGIFLEDGSLVENWFITTNKDLVFLNTAKSIKKYCEEKDIALNEILGYGVGIPGIMKNGLAVECVNLGWENINVIEQFKQALGYDALVEAYNDAKLAALGELNALKNKYKSIALITIGTGIGCGIVIDGKIYEGEHGLSGEIGHLRLDTIHQFKCGCGRVGCIETVCSATGMVRLAHLYGKDKDEKMMNPKLTAKEVLNEAALGNSIALKVLDEACSNLAKALDVLSLTINPNAFIIGGGVSYGGDLLLDCIKKHYFNGYLKQARAIDILLSNLRNDAGIYGAAALILRKKNGEKDYGNS